MVDVVLRFALDGGVLDVVLGCEKVLHPVQHRVELLDVLDHDMARGSLPANEMAASAMPRPRTSVPMCAASLIGASDCVQRPTSSSTTMNTAVIENAMIGGLRCRAPALPALLATAALA